MLEKEDGEFEELLSSLKPAKPSNELSERIRSSLEEARNDTNRSFVWSRFSWLGGATALAASLALVLVLNRETAPQTDPALTTTALEQSVLSPVAQPLADFNRVRSSNALIHAEQSPVFFTVEGIPVRDVYLKYLDTVVMENPKNGAVLTVSSPREERRLIPSVAY